MIPGALTARVSPNPLARGQHVGGSARIPHAGVAPGGGVRVGRLGVLPASVVAAALALLVGCSSPRLTDQVIGPSYVPANVHRREPLLPKEMRRVAVLPMTAAAADQQSEAGREILEPVYWTELNKIRHFEVVLISGAQLKSWTGRAAWSAGGQLPPRLFEQVRDQSGCQAVLFCQLNNYRAYPPLAVGWSLRLVEVERGAILWAIDELFDAGNPSVVNAARRYYQHQAQDARALYDSHSIVDSPRRFGAYTLSASLATMPGR